MYCTMHLHQQRSKCLRSHSRSHRPVPLQQYFS